jgi:uncharacterized cupin superfamily protein
MREARITETETGRQIDGEGWFVVNVADLSWTTTPGGGTWCSFEAEGVPQQLGIGVHVLPKGEPPGFYHWESNQEGFLVLSGECIAIVEGEERRLGQWDYLHCPPGTAHITIGAGDEPCAILMVGVRNPGRMITYPVEPAAAAYGASVSKESTSAREAYAEWPVERTSTPVPAPWPAR